MCPFKIQYINLFIFLLLLAVDPHPSIPNRFKEFQRKGDDSDGLINPAEERISKARSGSTKEMDEDLENLFVDRSSYVYPPKLDSEERWLGIDVWHLLKNLGKNLIAAAGQKKKFSDILEWKEAIVRHVCWSILHCDGNWHILIVFDMII